MTAPETVTEAIGLLRSEGYTEDVEQAGGTAMLWRARAESPEQERVLARQMTAARAAEYDQVRAEAAGALGGSDPSGAAAVLRRLRAELRLERERAGVLTDLRH